MLSQASSVHDACYCFLFNLATDSKEEIDLQFEYVSIFEQLRAEYQKWESELEPYSP